MKLQDEFEIHPVGFQRILTGLVLKGIDNYDETGTQIKKISLVKELTNKRFFI